MRLPGIFVVAAASVFLPFASAAYVEPVAVKVLLIGDSLTVGGFGDEMQESLLRKFGRPQVAIFASCGSSPEDWIKGDFVTNCGYRQTTPTDELHYEYENGTRPRPVKTPKLRTLLGHYRPEMVIVQQGTNWMDAISDAEEPDETRHRKIIGEFIKELKRDNSEVAIFWVLPPASSSYPASVHEEVDRWINEESARLGFYTFNSRSITGPYREGKSGVDGVHYNDEAGGLWAKGIFSKFSDAVKTLALARVAAGQ